jgi:Fe2+ transport system protein FeoA
VTTLGDLRPGQRGVVSGWLGEPPARLLEMGLLPGTAVEVVRRAPLGDPIDVRLRGYHLTLRVDEAAVVEVALA